MFKINCILVCMSVVLFGSSQSTSFDCKYKKDLNDKFEENYYCIVQNFVNITSPEAAQIDFINGTHLADYNNDNVTIFIINAVGPIDYFPRGLSNFFKNLEEIQIHDVGLKEIHQSDLKGFSNLKKLYSWENYLKILEENLFEFNPNLEEISLFDNEISHIDSNLFDKLTKLKLLDLELNSCISMHAYDNPIELQNIIRTVKSKCTNSDYYELEQKVKNLEVQSENLDSEKLKEKVEILENEVKNSKFSNFFQEKLQDLKAEQALKAAQTLKEKTQEATTKSPDNRTETMENRLKNLEENFNKLTRQIEEQNRKFEDNLAKIMQTLNIGE